MYPKLDSAIRFLIIEALKTRLDLTYIQIAAQFGVSEWMVNNIVVEENLRRKKGAGSAAFWTGRR